MHSRGKEYSRPRRVAVLRFCAVTLLAVSAVPWVDNRLSPGNAVEVQ